MSQPAFSQTIVASDIPPGGRHVRLEADAEQRRLLAAAMQIPDVTALTADLEVRPARGRAFRVRGRLDAEVVQTDVVTLEPVAQPVQEEIDVTLMPAEGERPRRPRAEVLVDIAEPDAPDLFHNGRIDLGAIVSEHLALGLDPYPRAADSAFAGHVEADDSPEASPFAALARLQREDE